MTVNLVTVCVGTAARQNFNISSPMLDVKIHCSRKLAGSDLGAPGRIDEGIIPIPVYSELAVLSSNRVK